MQQEYPTFDEMHKNIQGELGPNKGIRVTEAATDNEYFELVKDFDPNEEEADGGGARFDAKKVMVELLRPLIEWGISDVFTRGAIKYAANNWMRGMSWRSIHGPMKRHMMKWAAGEVYDKDTGCHHLFMVAWNASVLAVYQLMGLGKNDLGTKFDHEFESCKEIDAFDRVNNKPIDDYIQEIEEKKKGSDVK
jgi:hypothetical protein